MKECYWGRMIASSRNVVGVFAQGMELSRGVLIVARVKIGALSSMYFWCPQRCHMAWYLCEFKFFFLILFVIMCYFLANNRTSVLYGSHRRSLKKWPFTIVQNAWTFATQAISQSLCHSFPTDVLFQCQRRHCLYTPCWVPATSWTAIMCFHESNRCHNCCPFQVELLLWTCCNQPLAVTRLFLDPHPWFLWIVSSFAAFCTLMHSVLGCKGN